MSIVRTGHIVPALIVLGGLTVGPQAHASIAHTLNNDVIWQQQGSSGTTNALYTLKTNGTTSATSVPDGVVIVNGAIVGKGDLDGDGYGDLLQRNNVTGDLLGTLKHGATNRLTQTIFAGVDLNWRVAGVADFDGDGKADILWRNAVDQGVRIWFMNGLTISSNQALINVSSNWSVTAVGDFNGDNHADIIWRGANGDVFEWEMNGTSITSSGMVYAGVDTNWYIVGTGDFDNDGRSDLVWYNPTANQTLVWLMNGLAVKQFGSSYSTASLEFITVGDFDRNGVSELMFRNTSNFNLSVWWFSGTTLSKVTAPWQGAFGIGFFSPGSFSDPTAT